jgi:threonine dehydratase
MFDLTELEAAAELVHRHMPPTPTHAWPLLAGRYGTPVVVKHENHTPIGAFKVRGGIIYLDRMRRERPHVGGVVSATRGNHGQSLAFAARAYGLAAVIVVPRGNSPEKNRAMAAFGAELIEHGADFEEARQEAERIAAERGLEFVKSFHDDLVKGVATYALEMFRAHPDIATVYVPIGLGSGICGVIRTRDLLGLAAEVVGVVAENAPAYALSLERGAPLATNSAATFADGMAVRVPSPEALAIIRAGAARIVRVADDDIAEAVRILHEDTHNLAEGAGAAGLAALAKDQARRPGKSAVIQSGGNLDRDWAGLVMAGGTPKPR